MAVMLKEGRQHMQWYQDELLHMAKDLGLRLLPAFNTSSGLPYPRVRQTCTEIPQFSLLMNVFFQFFLIWDKKNLLTILQMNVVQFRILFHEDVSVNCDWKTISASSQIMNTFSFSASMLRSQLSQRLNAGVFTADQFSFAVSCKLNLALKTDCVMFFSPPA